MTPDMLNRSTEMPEIAFVDGVPMPPSVRPLIIVQGSDFESAINTSSSWSRSMAPGSHRTNGASSTTVSLCIENGNSRGTGRAQAVRGLRQGIRPRVDRHPEWHGSRGDQRGHPAHVPGPARLLRPVRGPVPWSPKSFVVPNRPACSGFAAWGRATKDGRLVCAGSGDDNAGFFAHTVMVFPESGNNFIASPYNMPGFGGHPSHPGMNCKGLAHVHHGTGTFALDKWGYTLPRGMGNMHILRYASSAKEAADMHLGYPPAVNYKEGNFFADVTGDALIIESRNPAVIRRSGYLGETDFLYHTNNSSSRQNGDPEEQDYIPHGGWLSKVLKGREAMDLTAWSVSRNLFMWNMLHNYQGDVDPGSPR